MDYQNESTIEPGVYVDAALRMVVVVDFITHQYNSVAGLVEALSPNYQIVVRPLIQSKEHVRECYPLDVFKEKFTKA